MVWVGLTAVRYMEEAPFPSEKTARRDKDASQFGLDDDSVQSDAFILTVGSRFRSMSASTHHHPGILPTKQTACECHPPYYALSHQEITSADIPKYGGASPAPVQLLG